MLSSAALLAAPPVVTDLVVGPATITLTFQDDGSSNQFTLQKNIGLDAANWGNANDAVLTSLGGNRYTFAVPRTAADKQFYRILGILINGTPLDPDGDGLPTALEITFSKDPKSPLYSDPNLFDTDGDGFSDGVEFAMGTLPNDPNSKPDLGGLPAVGFASSVSEATEGTSPHLIPITSSQVFSGTVHYTVNSRSTAKSPGAFATLSGTVSLVDGVGAISLALVDDLIISPERLILIDLTINPPGNPYRPSGAVTHIVNLSDNDGYWTGILTDEAMDTSRDFRLRILRNSSTTNVAFVSGSSDGLLSPDSGSSSQSTGLIPDKNLAGLAQEIFPATNPLLTSTRFLASTPPIPAVTGCVFAGVPLKRTIALDANTTLNGSHIVNQRTITGRFVETISHATDPGITYLNTTVGGVFFIVRDLPATPNLPSPFAP